MEITYCEKCGLLHDLSDGECLGCVLVKENVKMKDLLYKVYRDEIDVSSNKFFRLVEKMMPDRF